MAEINNSYVPVYISLAKYSDSKIDITRCEVLPGVRLERIPSYRFRMIDEINRIHGLPMPFKPTHGINIDNRKYRKNLAKRLINEGRTEEEVSEHFRLRLFPLHSKSPEERKLEEENQLDSAIVSAFDIAKHVLMSIVLIQPSPVDIGSQYSFKIKTEGSKPTYWLSSAQPPLEAPATDRLEGVIHQESAPRVNRRNITRLASALEKYYRPAYWLADRMAIALNSFWTGLRSSHLDQIFLSMTVVLEALLSTSNEGITHQIAERGAILLSKDANERYDIYKQVKNLYNIRSRLVHGTAFPKKGVQTVESLIIDAKMATVPVSKVSELVGIASKLIRTVLNNQELVSIVQRLGSEETVSRKLNEFFLKRLFE